MLDNGYVYLAATRLCVYRSQAEWAITIEVFGFSPRAGYPNLSVVTVGSTIRQTSTAADFVSDDAWRGFLAASPNWANSFFYPVEGQWLDDEYSEIVDASATSLLLRGREVALPSAADYAAAGVILSDAGTVFAFEACRALAYLHRDKVLATDGERRSNLPLCMARLMLLDDWRHPNLVDPDQMPSGSVTFRRIADMIVQGAADTCPTQEGNTHWSNWPDGGTL